MHGSEVKINSTSLSKKAKRSYSFTASKPSGQRPDSRHGSHEQSAFRTKDVTNSYYKNNKNHFKKTYQGLVFVRQPLVVRAAFPGQP